MILGLALPKQSERIPHMSAGPRFDDGSDDNLLIAVLKSVWWAMKTAVRKKSDKLLTSISSGIRTS